MLRARTALAERKASGFADNMSFTWRNPERSTTPTASVAEAQSIIVAALPYLVDDVTPPTGRRAHIARYARTDHYSILRTALRSAARNLKMAGERAVAFADDNALVDARPHTVPALAGSEKMPTCSSQEQAATSCSAALSRPQCTSLRNRSTTVAARAHDALTDAQPAPLWHQGSSMLADVSHGSCRNRGHSQPR